jgi:hypothetical protein
MLRKKRIGGGITHLFCAFRLSQNVHSFYFESFAYHKISIPFVLEPNRISKHSKHLFGGQTEPQNISPIYLGAIMNLKPFKTVVSVLN